MDALYIYIYSEVNDKLTLGMTHHIQTDEEADGENEQLRITRDIAAARPEAKYCVFWVFPLSRFP